MKINFFLNKNNRSVSERKKILKSIELKKINSSKLKSYLKFNKSYFDDKSLGIGYGTYKNDGRFEKSAKKFIKFFRLKKNSKILEIGCAKGFLLHEFKKKNMNVFGVDLSKYAVTKSHKAIRKNIKIQNVEDGIPFKNNFFDLVISKDTLPLIKKNKMNKVIREIIRVTKNKKNIYLYIQGVSKKNNSKLLKKWEPTTQIRWTSTQWVEKLKALGYNGFYEIKHLF
ncbi:class I SAM-dependent methyltransferase [Candidatus Pelagibacter ubique]|nr:class I SAM-dependent methyltransferase [Candidatus Pelagibacter ubique]